MVDCSKVLTVWIGGAPLAVGGNNSNTNKAETFNISTNTWTEVADYPYHDQ